MMRENDETPACASVSMNFGCPSRQDLMTYEHDQAQRRRRRNRWRNCRESIDGIINTVSSALRLDDEIHVAALSDHNQNSSEFSRSEKQASIVSVYENAMHENLHSYATKSGASKSLHEQIGRAMYSKKTTSSSKTLKQGNMCASYEAVCGSVRPDTPPPRDLSESSPAAFQSEQHYETPRRSTAKSTIISAAVLSAVTDHIQEVDEKKVPAYVSYIVRRDKQEELKSEGGSNTQHMISRLRQLRGMRESAMVADLQPYSRRKAQQKDLSKRNSFTAKSA